MRYRTLGKTGLKVSEIGLGTSKGLVEKISRQAGERLVARAIELGVNFIDTARHYGKGEAEARVGAAIQGRRESVHICTKCGTVPGKGRDFTQQGMINSIDSSLGKLGTDYLDACLLHMAGPGQLAQGCEAVETLLEFKRQGKTRFIGASVDGELMQRALALNVFDVLEVTYNLADLYPEESGFLDAAAKQGAGIVVKEPLAVANFDRAEPYPPWAAYQWRRLQHYGFLKKETRMPPAETALRFVLSAPEIHVAIPATSDIGHLESNIAASDGKGLPEDIDNRIRACYREAVSRRFS